MTESDVRVTCRPKLWQSLSKWLPGFKKGGPLYFNLLKTVLGPKFRDYASKEKALADDIAAKPGRCILMKQGTPIAFEPKKDNEDLADFVGFLANYVAINADKTTVEGGALVADIKQSHVTMTPLLRGRYTGVDGLHCAPFPLPFSVELTGLGPVSDALVGRLEWDSLAVVEARNALFAMDKKALEEHAKKWKARAARTVAVFWKLVQKYEESCYGDKSYSDFLERLGTIRTTSPRYQPKRSCPGFGTIPC